MDNDRVLDVLQKSKGRAVHPNKLNASQQQQRQQRNGVVRSKGTNHTLREDDSEDDSLHLSSSSEDNDLEDGNTIVPIKVSKKVYTQSQQAPLVMSKKRKQQELALSVNDSGDEASAPSSQKKRRVENAQSNTSNTSALPGAATLV